MVRGGTGRRRFLLTAGLAAGAAVVSESRSIAAGAVRPPGADDVPFGRTDEGGLSASDPSLPPRVRALIRIGDDGIAREDAAALRAFFDPGYRFHGPGGAELDRDGLWDYFARCRAAFEEFSVTRQAVVSDGAGDIACRTRFAGRFMRPFVGLPGGPLEPNGRRFAYALINVFRYAPDGRLSEEWAQYDVAAFLAQLRRPR